MVTSSLLFLATVVDGHLINNNVRLVPHYMRDVGINKRRFRQYYNTIMSSYTFCIN